MKKIILLFTFITTAFIAAQAQTEISGYLDTDPSDGIGLTAVSTYTWSNAINACRSLVHDGKTDWYMPSIEEILLFNPSTGTSQAVPGCTGTYCNIVTARRIWTRSAYPSNTLFWTVYTADATHSWINEGQPWNYASGYVRCVR